MKKHKKILDKYSVKVYWEMCGEREVWAESPEKAIERAHELNLPRNAEYVQDSINSDPDCDVQKIK